jgi:hypothetical protein
MLSEVVELSIVLGFDIYNSASFCRIKISLWVEFLDKRQLFTYS